MERRNTRQKELVLEAVLSMKRHVTAEEVYGYVAKDHPSVGKSTVYRNLAILAEDGKILKIEVPDAPDRYDFTLARHCHLHCIRCGAVTDVETDGMPDPETFVSDRRAMRILGCDIVFKGICPVCFKTEEENT